MAPSDASDIAHIDHIRGLTVRLNDQRKDGAFCDVLLKVCGQVLPTHSCVLSACSPFFHGLICGERSALPHLTQGAPQEIELVMPSIEGSLAAGLDGGRGLEAVLDLLDYIYTGKIQLKEESVNLVVQLSEALMLDGLSSLVRDYVNGSAGTNEDGEPKAVNPNPKSTGSKRGRTKRIAASAPILRQRKRKAHPRKLPAVRLSTLLTPKLESEAPPSNEEKTVEAAPPTVEPTPRTLRSRKRVARASLVEDDTASADPASDNNALRRNRNKKNTFKCGQCDFTSSDGSAVREHKKVHNRSKSFVCLTCGYFSSYCTRMLAHLLAADHPETKCSLCGVEASDHGAYVEHLKKHEDLKPFFCQLCDKRYRSQCLLARHLARHSSERPFVCDICGSGFKNKHFLLIHVSNHSAVKSFSCTQCSYKTSFKTNLNMHVRVHNEGKIPCPIQGCKFESISKYNLQSHLLTHAKQKPYQCEVCGQKFAQERSRRRHAKIHNPESMLRCGQCQFSTVSRYRLSEHVYKVHENGPPIPSKRVRKPRTNPRPALPPPPPLQPPPPQHQMQLPPPPPLPPNMEQIRKAHELGPLPPAVNDHVRMMYQDCQPILGGPEMYTPRMWFP